MVKRNWTAAQLRDYVQFRVIEDQARMSGAATPEQVQTLVIFLNGLFPDRQERIDVLRWLLDNPYIDSTNHLTKSQASVLISWQHTEEAPGEAARVAIAMRQGIQAGRGEEQLGFFGGGANETIDAIRGKIK